MMEGGAVPQEWEVMRKFAGPVEWEGTFEGFEKGTESRPKKLKLGLYVASHAYLKPESLSLWEKITAIPGSGGSMLPMISIKDAVPVIK
jgi:hypothetical protein